MFKKLIFLALIPFFFLGAESDHLHQDDIHRVMQQIFSQHLDKKTMSGEILTNSFKIYFEQFDPDGIYLLQSEVAPFISMGPQELEELEKQYRAQDYSIYDKLNEVIDRAIQRSRSTRAQLEKKPKELYEQALSPSFSPMKRSRIPTFAVNEKELEQKIKQYLLTFFHAEVHRFGEKAVAGFETQALALLEKGLRTSENQYLYRQENGSPLGKDEQENVFTLHVLKSLAKSLDAHTAFFDAQEAYDMRVRLEKGFEGIGIAFQQGPQGILVAHLLEGGPAAKNGQIKVGDYLTEINGQKTADVSFEKVMDLLRGKKDEPISLVFARGDKTIDAILKRETIVLDENRINVSSEKFGNGIVGKITLYSFYQNDKGVDSASDIKKAIAALRKEGNLRGLILDLRENSGGFLSQAVKVAGLFITDGIVVISKYFDGSQKIYRDIDCGIVYSGPLVVLTSRATASAAEIVAQALQDYGVALVVGDDHTYGKGTIQSQTVTNGSKAGSYFKVTVGEYFTVSGKTPQLSGVRADVVVPGPYSQMQLGEEYLEETVKKDDRIPPAFADNLSDIQPGLRPWFLRYYVPCIQNKVTLWRDEIPQLQKNSEYRLGKNKNYQLFLRKLNHPSALPKEKEADEEQLSSSSQTNNFGMDDLQLAETYNIIKDMIYLEAKTRQKEYAIGSTLDQLNKSGQ